MDWLSLFAGMLAGWLLEWLIDLFYWRRRYRALQQENAELRARLTEKETRILKLEESHERLTEAEADLATLRTTVSTAEIKIEELTARLHTVRARRAST